MNKTSYDIAIAGAGPAGLALAALLAHHGIKVALFERAPRTALENPSYDGREIALTHRSWAILEEIGATRFMPQGQPGKLRHAKVLNGPSPAALSFSADSTAQEALGYILSNHMIRKALFETVKEHENITLHNDSDIKSIRQIPNGFTLSDAQGNTYHTDMLVAADGRFSKIRNMLGVGIDSRDYGRVCMVMRLRHEKDMQETAYELFGHEYTMALLPLATTGEHRECSLVLTVPPARAQALLAMDDKAFIEAVADDNLRRYCGDAVLVSQRHAYPLVGVYAHAFAGDRWALIGDAAIGMHPVTAHGFNLGLRAAESLCRHMIAARAVGYPLWHSHALTRFQQELRHASWPLYHGTNALVGLYTDKRPLAQIARTGILRAGMIAKPLRRIMVRALMDTRLPNSRPS